MPVQEERSENKLKIVVDSEHTKCSICLNVWHDVVTVAPCLHNFCNGCFSEWLRRCQGKHSTVLCPYCRGVVHFVGRNHFLPKQKHMVPHTMTGRRMIHVILVGLFQQTLLMKRTSTRVQLKSGAQPFGDASV